MDPVLRSHNAAQLLLILSWALGIGGGLYAVFRRHEQCSWSNVAQSVLLGVGNASLVALLMVRTQWHEEVLFGLLVLGFFAVVVLLYFVVSSFCDRFCDEAPEEETLDFSGGPVLCAACLKQLR